MEWRKRITDLVDEEVVECLKKVFSDIKEVTKIERDKFFSRRDLFLVGIPFQP